MEKKMRLHKDTKQFQVLQFDFDQGLRKTSINAFIQIGSLLFTRYEWYRILFAIGKNNK